jgi:hypothetical protein
VVTTPVWLVGAVEAHALTPTGPFRVHVIFPVGAAEPVVPVASAVKVRVEFSAPPPLALKTIEGAVFAITTVVEDAAARAT